MTTTISAQQLRQMIERGEKIELIDVRTPAEFEQVHVSIARNVPLDSLDPVAVQTARNGSSQLPLYVICRSGARGGQACQRFVSAGITNVVNVEGGTMACAAANVPVVRSARKAMPLNCQVQLITGSLVVIGSAMAYFDHRLWSLLPAVMGLGLMYSGATDTCAMGACLARMPWNQR